MPQSLKPSWEYEEQPNTPTNPSSEPSFGEIVNTRFNRRNALKGFFATVAGLSLVGCATGNDDDDDDTTGTTNNTPAPTTPSITTNTESTLRFKEISHEITTNHAVAEGYSADVLIRWGDKVLADAPAWDHTKLTAAAQLKQFGYNCDFIGYLPLPVGSQSSENGLLCINHEYTNRELMWTNTGSSAALTKEQVDVEMAAHGHSIVEVKKTNGKWQVVEGSKYARRISMLETVMEATGPARGHDLMKTAADPSGSSIIGTLNDCAGGVTPWGTVLIGEENFDGYFTGDATKANTTQRVKDAYKRYGVPAKFYNWGDFHDRMNVEKEANESHRFGWLVEIDPYNPSFVPKKRTALGRFKHEGAGLVINKDGRAVVYSGDDQRFDYVYKFVSKNKYDAANREANFSLLDEGTLYVGKFNSDGTLTWLPLVQGTGPLTAENGFASQAEVLIFARLAADALKATPMDRPEDVEVSPVTGKVYMACTNNTSRTAAQIDAANPRASNTYGHIIEMIPPGFGKEADHTATTFTWNIFLKAGNPKEAAHGASYHAAVTENGWMAAPDNVAFDKNGRLFISTDQGSAQATSKISDGIYITDTEGFGRALTKFFYKTPIDAEMCGPMLTPDAKTLFVAVQHPAESSKSTFDNPTTRWPDFKEGVPPRPSVVAITKNDGGEIGN